jgi:hypothetical protein
MFVLGHAFSGVYWLDYCDIVSITVGAATMGGKVNGKMLEEEI